jgi:hypothetical protein
MSKISCSAEQNAARAKLRLQIRYGGRIAPTLRHACTPRSKRHLHPFKVIGRWTEIVLDPFS